MPSNPRCPNAVRSGVLCDAVDHCSLNGSVCSRETGDECVCYEDYIIELSSES